MWPAAPAQFPTSALTLCYDSRANLALSDLMQHSDAAFWAAKAREEEEEEEQ